MVSSFSVSHKDHIKAAFHGQLFLKHPSDGFGGHFTVFNLGVMQKIDDNVIRHFPVNVVDKVPEVKSQVGEFLIAGFFRPVEKLINQQILAVINDVPLQSGR